MTHGLIGQYIRGEVSLCENKPISKLLYQEYLHKDDLKEILYALNQCIISAVSEELWLTLESEVVETIDLILNDLYTAEYSLKERLRRLRANSIKNGEDFAKEYAKVFADTEVYGCFQRIFSNLSLWYVEASLYDFSFEEFIKVFLLLLNKSDFEKG